MNKKILLGSFILPEQLDWFFKRLEDKFLISKNNVFVYEDVNDKSKLIVTFKINVKEDNRINFNNISPNTILIHKKGDAIYTINALNKLIELEFDGEIGNINHKSIKIDWDKYQNKLILVNNNELVIININKIF